MVSNRNQEIIPGHKLFFSHLPAYLKNPQELFVTLETSMNGLREIEVKERLDRFGYNRLPEQKRKSWFLIFLQQFQNPLIYVLIAADSIVLFLKEYADGFIILGILLFNALLGALQEGRAENVLSTLSKFTTTNTTVIRDGATLIIPDVELVPGDIILLQEGEKIPADARLLEVHGLLVEEAALTGESEPITKTAETLFGNKLSTAEQKNMVFKGTTISTGTGKALVIETGIHTIIGAISTTISEINTEIPLTKDLRSLSRTVVLAASVLVALLFTLGVLQGQNAKEMFIAAVAIAVAAVPEGLPLVLTVTLSAGVHRMAKRRVLVKKLQAVEALGQTQRIAVDKTGTITMNELVVEKIITADTTFSIKGTGYEPKPNIRPTTPELERIGLTAALVSNARVSFIKKDKRYELIGDPTEGAMTVLAAKLGFEKDTLLETYKPVNDWPFDYRKKFHLSLYKKENQFYTVMAGAPEIVIENTYSYIHNNQEHKFTKDVKEKFLSQFLEFSRNGFRVIGLASCEGKHLFDNPETVPPLTLIGFLVMRDALRPHIKEQIQEAEAAGIRVIMITGDHAMTATAIAKAVGIYKPGDEVLTGEDIDMLPPEELTDHLSKTTVFARVTPEHKMKIIEGYKRRGEIIAMTGDGVNDAPSLIAADLGIAMGKIGTEVAKEAADLILLDDNFGDIIYAIEEGRNLRQGLRRAITYLLSSNLGELLLITLALLAHLPLPLLASQIIWLNVVTDTFFDIALSLEPKDPLLMKKSTPIPKKLFDRLIAQRLLVIAPCIALGSLWLFLSHLTNVMEARTIALSGLVIYQWFNALNCRSEEKSILKTNFFSNKFLLITFFVVILLQVTSLYLPFMQKILQTTPLGLTVWGEIILLGTTVFIAEEIRKFLFRKKLRGESVFSSR